MSDDEIESQLYKVKQSHIDASTEVLKLIRDLAGSPADACLILLLAHVDLWNEFGVSSPPVMLTSYVTDFISLVKLIDEKSEQPLQ